MAITQSSRAENPADRPQRSLKVAATAAQIAQDNSGQDIVLLDLRELTPVFDYFLVVTGTSNRQLHAIADDIEQTLKKEFGEKRLGMEGYVTGGWILLDYGDIVVHLFDPKAREYYALDQLWSDARRVKWEAAEPRIAKLN